MNHSKQRDIIESFMKDRKDHPTASKIYDEVKKIDPKISIGTVYRNLNLLVENKNLMRLTTEEHEDHFDPNTKNHIHFVCCKCNNLYDVMDIDVEKIRKNFSKSIDGDLDDVNIMCYGTCSKCKNSANHKK